MVPLLGFGLAKLLGERALRRYALLGGGERLARLGERLVARAGVRRGLYAGLSIGAGTTTDTAVARSVSVEARAEPTGARGIGAFPLCDGCQRRQSVTLDTSTRTTFD